MDDKESLWIRVASFHVGPIVYFSTIALLVTSVGLNMMLARKTKTLKDTIHYIKAEQLLTVGTKLPPIEAKTLEGKPEILNFGPDIPPTLVYVFTPPCGWCSKNLESIKALSSSTSGRYRVIGLSLSTVGLTEYVANSGFTFPVYGEISPTTVMSYRLGGTPDTYLISREGTLIKQWKGAYLGEVKKDIESYFSVELPEIKK